MTSTAESSYVILSPADSTSPVPSANISYPAFFDNNHASVLPEIPSTDPQLAQSLPGAQAENVQNEARRCKSLDNGKMIESKDMSSSSSPEKSRGNSNSAVSFERIRSMSNDPGVSSSCSSTTSSSFSEACENLERGSTGDFYSEFEAVLRNLRIENESLRTVVDANNAAMKRQLKIVQSWQEEVVDMRKAYADLKEESEERIMQLKQEKEDLLDKMDRVEPRNRSISRTSIGSESSYFWDSNDLTELRSKIERLQELETSNAEKVTQLDDALAQLARANEKCQLLNSEVNELRKQLFGNPNVIPVDGAPDGLISVLRAQIRHCQQETVAESQAKMQAMDRITQLQNDLEEVRREKLFLEQKLSMGLPVVDLRSKVASAPPLPFGITDDNGDAILDVNGGKHRHKHQHHKEPSSRKIRHLIKK